MQLYVSFEAKFTAAVLASITSRISIVKFSNPGIWGASWTSCKGIGPKPSLKPSVKGFREGCKMNVFHLETLVFPKEAQLIILIPLSA